MDSRIQTCTWADISIQRARAGVKRFWRALILAVVAAVLYASVLIGLIRQWHYDGNYSHGFLVPVFVGYLIWRKRKDRHEKTKTGLCGLLDLAKAESPGLSAFAPQFVWTFCSAGRLGNSRHWTDWGGPFSHADFAMGNDLRITSIFLGLGDLARACLPALFSTVDDPSAGVCA